MKVILDDNRIHLPEEAPIKFMIKGDLKVLIGGYWDGRLLIQNLIRKKETLVNRHLYRITCIEINKEEDIIITGTEKGDIIKWIVDDFRLKISKSFFHHKD
jgi:hypothetical protein